MHKAGGWLLLLSLGFFLSACTLVPKTPEPLTPKNSAAGDALPDGEGWWYARFFIDRPDGESPQWHIDTLLAGEVVAPVFEHHYRDILIWRFHRRAADDDYGHVFSFIFYSTAEGAQRVYNELGAHPVLAQLRRDGQVTRVAVRRPGRDHATGHRRYQRQGLVAGCAAGVAGHDYGGQPDVAGNCDVAGCRTIRRSGSRGTLPCG